MAEEKKEKKVTVELLVDVDRFNKLALGDLLDASMGDRGARHRMLQHFIANGNGYAPPEQASELMRLLSIEEFDDLWVKFTVAMAEASGTSPN